MIFKNTLSLGVYFFTFLDNKFTLSLENPFLNHYNKIRYIFRKEA